MAITRLEVPGGEYCEALVGGQYAVELTNQHVVQTHAGNVPTPGEDVLYVRCTNVGGFRFAGQSSTGRGDVEYKQTGPGVYASDVVGSGYGDNSVLYLSDGTLRTATPADGAQGLRYENTNGTVVTGDASHLTADQLVADYTDLFGVTIGQDQRGLNAIVQLNGVLRVIEPGDCQFIRVNSDGVNWAIGITKLSEKKAVLLWCTTADLAGLPVLVEPVQPPAPVPAPTPTPNPPQVPPVSVPPFDPTQDQATSGWTDPQLQTAIALELQAANSDDDPVYWFNAIRSHPTPVTQPDWFYWVGRIKTGDGAGKGYPGASPVPVPPSPVPTPVPAPVDYQPQIDDLKAAIATLSDLVNTLAQRPVAVPISGAACEVTGSVTLNQVIKNAMVTWKGHVL